MGSGGAIVMDEDNCMVDVAKFYLEFICDESCGKCSQCRIGTKRLLELLTTVTEGKATMEDLTKLQTLSESISAGSLCGLGQTAPNPVLSTLNKFKDVYVRHVQDKKCSLCARNCPVNAISGVVGKEPFTIDLNKCIKCGTCISACKFNAIYKR